LAAARAGRVATAEHPLTDAPKAPRAKAAADATKAASKTPRAADKAVVDDPLSMVLGAERQTVVDDPLSNMSISPPPPPEAESGQRGARRPTAQSRPGQPTSRPSYATFPRRACL